MDYFYEQLLRTQKTFAYKFVNISTYIFLCLALFFLGTRNIIFTVICVIMAVGMFFGKKYMVVEYEYSFTNGELDIDVIYEMKKRKRCVQFDLKDVELMAPKDSCYLKDFHNIPQKQKKLYNNNNCKDIYYVIVNVQKEGRVLLKIAPNNILLDMCYRFNPRNVKKS